MTPVHHTRKIAPGLRMLALGTTLAAATMVLQGCATRSDGSTVTMFDDVSVMRMDTQGLDPASARQLERAQRYAQMRVEAGGIGGAVGGGLGGLAAGLATDDWGIALAGAVGGAIIGAQAGYMTGAYIANLNETAENRRDTLEAQLAAAERAVAENALAVADNRLIVAAERQRINDLTLARRTGRVTQQGYRDELTGLKERLTIVDESLRLAENDLTAVTETIQGRASAGQSYNGLPAQRQKLMQDVEELTRLRAELISVALGVPAEDRDAAGLGDLTS